jgi:hypothetical protein
MTSPMLFLELLTLRVLWLVRLVVEVLFADKHIKRFVEFMAMSYSSWAFWSDHEMFLRGNGFVQFRLLEKWLWTDF